MRDSSHTVLYFMGPATPPDHNSAIWHVTIKNMICIAAEEILSLRQNATCIKICTELPVKVSGHLPTKK